MNLDEFKKDNKILMLALDHRESFKKLMNPESPEQVSDDSVIDLKSEIINSIKDQFSGLLIDEDYGIKAYTERTRPFLLPIEKTGYTDQGGERLTELQYSIEDLKNYGASGAKILLYFNPDVPSSKEQLDTARKVIEESKKENFPLFLEIRVYLPDNGDLDQVRSDLVIRSLKMFVEQGLIPDVFKLEYPGDASACNEITNILGDTPWILLTKGDTFDLFKDDLKIAINAGAQGFLAGRALWQEVTHLSSSEKENFLKTTLPDRFREIASVAKDGMK